MDWKSCNEGLLLSEGEREGRKDKGKEGGRKCRGKRGRYRGEEEGLRL